MASTFSMSCISATSPIGSGGFMSTWKGESFTGKSAQNTSTLYESDMGGTNVTSKLSGVVSLTSTGTSPTEFPLTVALSEPLPASLVLKERVAGFPGSLGMVVPVCFTWSG